MASSASHLTLLIRSILRQARILKPYKFPFFFLILAIVAMANFFPLSAAAFFSLSLDLGFSSFLLSQRLSLAPLLDFLLTSPCLFLLLNCIILTLALNSGLLSSSSSSSSSSPSSLSSSPSSLSSSPYPSLSPSSYSFSPCPPLGRRRRAYDDIIEESKHFYDVQESPSQSSPHSAQQAAQSSLRPAQQKSLSTQHKCQSTQLPVLQNYESSQPPAQQKCQPSQMPAQQVSRPSQLPAQLTADETTTTPTKKRIRGGVHTDGGDATSVDATLSSPPPFLRTRSLVSECQLSDEELTQRIEDFISRFNAQIRRESGVLRVS